jgi:hypothetical protein
MQTRRDGFLLRLRDQLIIAAVGVAPVAACGETKPPLPPESKERTTPPIAPLNSDATPDSSTTALPPTASAALPNAMPPNAMPPSAAPPTAVEIALPPPKELPPNCYTPKSIMRSVGTGEPSEPPPPKLYDKNGCLPVGWVTNSCCNGATAGPRFKDGACCYTIPVGPCCGRPFIVDGKSITAEVVARQGWTSRSDAESNSPVREQLRDSWLRDAQMEHASIASFARFAIELLSIGADAAFVRLASEAMRDEVLHAELCFGLASRFGSETMGPGPLPTAPSSYRSLNNIVESVIVEGCIGETLAAFVASERLARTVDPEAREVLTRIREDEARHAELAWRFLGWVLRDGRCSPSVIANMVDVALSRMGTPGLRATPDAELNAYGVFNDSQTAEAMDEGLRRVVLPTFEALFAKARHPSLLRSAKIFSAERLLLGTCAS